MSNEEIIPAADRIDYVQKDRDEAKRYADALIKVVNDDHEDSLHFSRDIGCCIRDHIETLRRELAQSQQWVKDLQSGMYVNCVYCGHRYGPKGEVPESMADVLKQHIEKCPKHPMSALRIAYGLALELHGCGGDNCTEEALIADANRLLKADAQNGRMTQFLEKIANSGNSDDYFQFTDSARAILEVN